MDKVIRDLFKKTRTSRGLNQTAVADKGDITQGTVSKIEIEPEYEPTVAIFRKALHGLGMSVTTFFAQIEGTSTDLSSLTQVDRDEGLPPLPSDQEMVEALLRKAGEIIARQEDTIAAARRQAPTPRATAAENAPPDRTIHRRPAQRKTKRRRR